MVRKLTLCAGAGFLWALATPVNTTWTASLASVGGSNVAGTATVDVSSGPAAPTMATPDTTKVPGDTGRQMKPYQAKPDSSKIPGDTGPAVSPGGSGSARAAISISGAKAGEYPWRISSGRCGSDGPAVGSEGSYPPIKVQSDGRGTASASVAFQPMPGSDYSVSVQKSKTEKAVISCGNLQAAGQPSDSMRMPMPTRDTTAPRP